jgi:hypothetical protein
MGMARILCGNTTGDVRQRSGDDEILRVRKKAFVPTRVGVLSLASVLAHAGSQPNSIAQAKKVFADARAVSAKEGGRLWGRKLYGRLLLVDPKTRAVVANEPDPQGVLHATEGVYVGTLPSSLIISNAPTEWEGLRWSMLMWFTIPDDITSRRITLAHELFTSFSPKYT